MWSSLVAVHPWVGAKFDVPENLLYKTLILGESNFTEPEQFGFSLVEECVRDDMATGENRDTTGFCRFSTKIRRMIFGRDENIGPNGFWQDVAFYNFVQSLVGNTARIRPTAEMWKESTPAFFEIVSTLKPSRILVLGKANWNNLLKQVEHDTVDQFVAKLKIGGELITAGYVNHPSSSFSYSVWQPIAQRLLFT